jgi:hypothetical protein
LSPVYQVRSWFQNFAFQIHNLYRCAEVSPTNAAKVAPGLVPVPDADASAPNPATAGGADCVVGLYKLNSVYP